MLDTIDSYATTHEHNQRAKDVLEALRSAGVHELQRTSARGMAIVGTKAAVVGGG